MNSVSNQLCVLGLGSRSTQFYIEALHERYHNCFGNYHTFPFILYQIDFNRINIHLPNQFDQLIPELTDCLNSISRLPTQRYLIPNITLHETLDKIDHDLSIIHPIELTINYCSAQDINEIVLFGSQYTMQSSYISKALKAQGITTIIPSDQNILEIDDFRKKLYTHSDSEEDFSRYKKLIDHYTASYHVVIACTELSLNHKKLYNEKLIDMAMLQIDHIIPA
ncbi:aspartate/glutamate racemase family protein [uncultured Psychroserpens sp.]|uniref:aspartate/glutamate racemase family protein n=1 Tax=uncultured Psychroserpens sp. TaxID=255436 RepID=UPI002622BDB1|nr:aspartate/glutamate racemase family protein [uncultured Psychroserpens sp.]